MLGISQNEGIVAGSRRRRWHRRIGWAAIAILLLAACASLYVYSAMKQAADRMYKPLSADKPVYVSRDPAFRPSSTSPSASTSQAGLDPAVTGERNASFTVLLLGVDQRSGDFGRSDTMLLMTVNPNRGSVLQFHIPRDTRTRIVPRGFEDKINHAYAYGGIEGAVATVEHFLDVPIDYYLQVNMEGFVALVDLLGGVEVNNPFAFEYLGHAFVAGPQHLNGEQALKYARMRYDDPRGDLGRNVRQRQVVNDLLRRASRWNGLKELPDLLDGLANHVQTNVSFEQMQRWLWQLQRKNVVVETTEIQGRGVMLNGIYYYQVDEDERLRLHNAVKDARQDLTSTLRIR